MYANKIQQYQGMYDVHRANAKRSDRDRWTELGIFLLISMKFSGICASSLLADV